MKQGTIQKLMDRGYGFIKPDDSEEELFFHATELQNGEFNELSEGATVEFEVAEGKTDEDGNVRMNAVNVNVIS